MRLFISSLNVPIGYSTPEFPSLFWPLGPSQQAYQNSFLYYSWDIWKFTVFWSLILFGALYIIVGTIAAISNILNKFRHKLPIGPIELFTCLFILGFYIIVGLFKGFCSGAIIGLIISAIYEAGSLTMSTWIPLTWAIIGILYDIALSYLTSRIIL